MWRDIAIVGGRYVDWLDRGGDEAQLVRSKRLIVNPIVWTFFIVCLSFVV